MNRLVRNVAVLISLQGALSGISSAEAWLHVDIKERGDEEAATVKVNLPLSMIENLLPAIQEEHLQGGKLKLDLDDNGRTEVDVRAILRALNDTPDGDFVRIRDREDSISVSKSRGYLLVQIDGRGETPEKVRVRMPMALATAIAESEGDELDLTAVVRALGRHRGEDLVTVEDGATQIRVWIDETHEPR